MLADERKPATNEDRHYLILSNFRSVQPYYLNFAVAMTALSFLYSTLCVFTAVQTSEKKKNGGKKSNAKDNKKGNRKSSKKKKDKKEKDKENEAEEEEEEENGDEEAQ